MADTPASPSPSRPVFLPLLLSVVLVLSGAYIAVRSGIASEALLPALNHTAPALSRVDPILDHGLEDELPRPRLARRVALVIIDGLGLRESYGLPFLDSLRRRGVDASATSHYPTLSRPNHVAVVTGVPPRASGVRTNDYNTEVRLDSLMDRAAAAGMRSAFVADKSNGLPWLFTRIEDDGDRPRHESAFHDANFANWPAGLSITIERLVEDGYPLMVIIPGRVDAAGHESGAASSEYVRAAREADRMLARALARLDLDLDTVIITSDHGHTAAGGHGGTEPEVTEVPLILAGAGVRPGAAVAHAELVDVAPTVAALLGMPPPGHGVGRTLTEALVLGAETRAAMRSADQRRSLRNQMIVEAWRRDGKAKVSRTRMWRVPVVAVLLSAGLFFILGARRARALHIDWRVLVIALPAFPLTYYALVATLGQQFSPSAIPERGSLVAILFRFGLLSMAAHIVIGWFAFRGRVVLADRLATANGLFLCGLLSALVPIGLAWSILPGPFVAVPGPVLMVLIPATYVACACYALAVVAMLSLEIVVFFARAVDPRALRSRLGARHGRLPESGAM